MMKDDHVVIVQDLELSLYSDVPVRIRSIHIHHAQLPARSASDDQAANQ